MFKYVTKRFLLSILTLAIVLIFSYTLIVAFIKNPFWIQLEKGGLNPQETARVYALAVAYDKVPIIQKIITYFGTLFDFSKMGDKSNFGEIFFPKGGAKNIPDLFFGPLKWSILVSFPAFIISALLGTILGITAGYKRGKTWDSAVNVFVLIFVAVPSFIIAPFMINIFGALGFSPIFISPQAAGKTWADTLMSILPAILTITLGSLAVYTLYSRNQVVTVLTSNYVLIAKTKGLSNLQIFRKYVFRNISIPLITIILPSYIVLLSGSIIIEKFWGVPGSSTIIAQAFPEGEINVVMFNILFFTALSLITEIIVDISYVIIDPRIKYESSSGLNLVTIFKAYITRKQEIKQLTLSQLKQ